MAIIKCKMCGGNIEISADKTYGTCDSCGSTMTFPRVSDEQRVNLFNRANHFRRQNDFDKAIVAYERILEEDANDAEAHWGIVLSRYGIEYVEDPVSHERIPTCHRVQLGSILADPDLLSALEHAPDAYSAQLYRKEAEQIAEIQKGILAISAQEEPYDVFICYKESTDGGSRTKDSTIAQDIYYQLTGEGYKVFFSRITLEDKLGQQYEPYIFAALNSARVMLAIGTKPEHFSAVWVKNEWSRFLALMKQDRTRLLIPCYRDMDPYDLPEELSALQSQDMSKIGFMQDLLHGIRKVVEGPRATDTIQADRLQPVSAAPGVSSLMERARLFMEDGDWGSADEYLERVLDIDPKYAPAYAAKACVAFKMSKETDLADATFLYTSNPHWQKALRFADSAQKAIYEGYIAKVRDRVNAQIRTYAYDCAVEMAVYPFAIRQKLDEELTLYKEQCTQVDSAHDNSNRRPQAIENDTIFKNAIETNEPGSVSEEKLQIAADMFSAIHDAKADACAQQCLVLAEQARQKAIYDVAMSAYQTQHINRKNALLAYRKQYSNPAQLDRIAAKLLSIPDYKDAQQQAKLCQEEAEQVRSKIYSDAEARTKSAKRKSSAWHEAKELLDLPELNEYRDVAALRQVVDQKYAERIAAEKRTRFCLQLCAILVPVCFIVMIYVCTQTIIPKHHYEHGIELRNNGWYGQAIEEFADAGNYSDAPAQIRVTYYAQGESLRNAGDWDGAMTAFASAGEYNDAATQISATYYAQGEALRTAGDWDGAAEAFTNAGEYGDATTQVSETHYQHAQFYMNVDDYKQAYRLFVTIKGYKDVDTLLANDVSFSSSDVRLSVGCYVTFGTYPQTAEGNDKTPIEWLVLDRDGDKALLLSCHGLDVQKYNAKSTRTTWEKCTLRTWLNIHFMYRAFSEVERSAILLTKVDNSSSQGYWKWNTDGGSNTEDKVFLLSYAEADKYLNADISSYNNIKSRMAPTEYAVAQGAYRTNYSQTADGKDAGTWWLRSSGKSNSEAAYVNAYGYSSSGDVDHSNLYIKHSVRPAIWVDITADVFWQNLD